MEKVRWGLLSTANINRRLIPAIRASDRGELIAVASRDYTRARSYADMWGIPSAYGSYEEMLTSDKIDCVYVGLPNHLHAEWSIKSMQSGKHVLCEKPFALSVTEVDRMIAASRENDRVLAEAFMYRHHPQTKIAGEWVRSGKLGEILQLFAVFNFQLTNPSNVRWAPEFGGGCLWDVGVYPLSFAQYFFGDVPNWVLGAQKISSSGVDATFSGIMGYKGNGIAQIQSSFQSRFFTYAEIIGTQGRLSFNRPFVGIEDDGKLVFTPIEGETITIPVPPTELYAGEINDMHGAILDHTSSYLTLQESRDHIRTVIALYKSAVTNTVTYIDEIS